MQDIFELTHFVGDVRNCHMANLDDLIEVMEDGRIDPRGESAGAACFVEPQIESIEALRMSGFGIGFSPEFLSGHGLREHRAMQTIPADAGHAIRIWEMPEPLSFAVEDIQTLYVRGQEAVLTLRILFPRYTGTFVIC